MATGVVFVVFDDRGRVYPPPPLVGRYEDEGTQPPRVRVWCGAPACRVKAKDHTAIQSKRCAEQRALAAGWPRWMARLTGEFTP